jgi:hypothetical protein
MRLAALLFKAAHKLHAHIPITEKIDLKDPAQIIIIGFIAGFETGPDTGIIKQYIDMAEMRPRLIGQSSNLVFIGDIACHADRLDPMTQSAHRRRRFIASRLVNIGNDDMAFFGRQTFGNIKPNAIGPAAYHRDFIFEIFHCHLLICRQMLALCSFTCNAQPAIYKG